MQRNLERYFVSVTDVAKPHMMDLKGKRFPSGLPGGQFEQSVLRAEFYDHNVIALCARNRMQIGAPGGNVNAEAVRNDAPDPSRLAKQVQKRAFNGQPADGDDRILGFRSIVADG